MTKETSWEKPVTEAYRAAAKLCAERGIRSLPCTQIWVGGKMVKEVRVRVGVRVWVRVS